MSTYAQVTDYESYTNLPINTISSALPGLVDKAENDIDKVLHRTPFLTDTVLGISLSGVSSGNFELELAWRGINYVSGPIAWNSVGQDVITALQAMQDPYGNLVPLDSWQIPDARFYQQKWAFGPLPNTPVVVQARNSMGRQALPPLTVVNNTLAGANPVVTVQVVVGGGLRINPYVIPADVADALKAAVCAQAEYRDQMGEAFFARAQFTEVTGPEFRTRGKLPLIGPKVMRELIGTDLIQRGARARPGTATGAQTVYTPIGSVPIPDDWRAV